MHFLRMGLYSTTKLYSRTSLQCATSIQDFVFLRVKCWTELWLTSKLPLASVSILEVCWWLLHHDVWLCLQVLADGCNAVSKEGLVEETVVCLRAQLLRGKHTAKMIADRRGMRGE